MKSNNLFSVLGVLVSLAFFACGSSNDSSAPACTNAAGPTIPTSNTNVIPLYIGDPNTTGGNSYQNEPLVSVTICTPNHSAYSQCQVISNILLDTGSSGLRIFGSAINSNVQLSQVTISTPDGTESLAECPLFGSGADWGPIQRADVLFGNQVATNTPIQVINYNYPGMPSFCAQAQPDTDPCTAGYNGILGVAPYVADCGSECVSTDVHVNQGIYLACDDSGCYDGTYAGNCGQNGCAYSIPLSSQVSNPVALFAAGYNNGISLQLPGVGGSGASGVIGSLTLGIPTTTVNAVYPIDPNGATDNQYLDFDTTFNGTLYGYQSANQSSTAFLDSGSNAIYFPGNLSTCPNPNPKFFCPAMTQYLSATVAGYQGTSSTPVSFSIGNTLSLLDTGNSAFSNLGGPASAQFDWGLPFFFNRTVYVGIEGTSATINSSSVTGPYWAF